MALNKRLESLWQRYHVVSDAIEAETKHFFPVGCRIRWLAAGEHVQHGEVVGYTGFGARIGLRVKNERSGKTVRVNTNWMRPART